MAQNEAFARAVHLSLPAPSAPNGGLGPSSGDPVLFGVMAGVCEASYTPPGSRTPSGEVPVAFEGAFLLSVTAATALSPLTGHALNPGDKVYADGGTYDATTGFTTGFTLDANTGGTYFGNVLQAVGSGLTATVMVRLKVTG